MSKQAAKCKSYVTPVKSHKLCKCYKKSLNRCKKYTPCNVVWQQFNATSNMTSLKSCMRQQKNVTSNVTAI